MERGQSSAMELIDFAIESFGGCGLDIERGGDDAAPGLFFRRAGELLGFDFDLGPVGSNLVIEESRFGGLGSNQAPFVGHEAIDEFAFGSRAGGGQTSHPALTEEFVLLGAFVSEQDRGGFFFGAAVATVDEPGLFGPRITG